jgi:hypothetical protein
MNELNQHEYLLRSVYNTLEGIRGIREAGASDLAIIEILDRSYNVLVKRAPPDFLPPQAQADARVRIWATLGTV